MGETGVPHRVHKECIYSLHRVMQCILKPLMDLISIMDIKACYLTVLRARLGFDWHYFQVKLMSKFYVDLVPLTKMSEFFFYYILKQIFLNSEGTIEEIYRDN